MRTLRFRWASFVGTFLALTLGVALVTTMGLVLAATFDAPTRSPQRYAEAPVVVLPVDEVSVSTPLGTQVARLSDTRGVPRELVAELKTAGRVAVDRTFPLAGGQVGHPWSAAAFTPYRLASGRAPATDREVVVAPDGPHPGDRVVVGVTSYVVTGVTEPIGFEKAVFFTDAEAARRSPRIDAVVVYGRAEAVSRIVGDRAKVVSGQERRSLDPDAARDSNALISANSLVGTAGGIAAFVSAFLVASTFAFTVSQRRREFALLRTAGASAGQIRRLVLAEATVVGVVAAGAGMAVGWHSGPLLAARLVDLGLAPSWFTVGASHWPLYVAFATGLLMAVLGAWAAARRAGAVHPAEALREAAADRRGMSLPRWLLGLSILGIALAMLVAPLMSDPGAALKRKQYIPLVMLLLVAAAVLGPVVVPLVARLVTWPLSRLRGATGLLARQTALATTRHTVTAAAPILITVGLAACLLGCTATVDQARAQELRDQLHSDLVVAPRDSPGMEPSTVERVRAVPGIEVAAVYQTEMHDIEDDGALVKRGVTAVDPVAMTGMLDLPVVAGALADLRDDSIVVDEEWHRHPGDLVSVWLADGSTARFRVAAVISTGANGNGAYVTTAHAGGTLAERMLVRYRSGKADVAAALRPLAVTVTSAADWVDGATAKGNSASRAGLWVLLGIALVYSGLSVASTLAMANRGRRDEFRMLRLAGATSGQILKIVAADSLTIVLLGMVLAAAATACTLAGIAGALARLGAPVTLTIPWAPVGATTAACALVAVVASVLSAASTLRRP
jgi:putative ABC transport system permease protein